jgi:hypothetical protein
LKLGAVEGKEIIDPEERLCHFRKKLHRVG